MIKPTYFSSRKVCICNKTLHLTARYNFDSELRWSMQSLMALCGMMSCGPGCICIQTQAAGKSHNTPQMGPPRNSSNSLDRLGIPFWWLHIQKLFTVSKGFDNDPSASACLCLYSYPSVPWKLPAGRPLRCMLSIANPKAHNPTRSKTKLFKCRQDAASRKFWFWPQVSGFDQNTSALNILYMVIYEIAQ